MTSDRLAEIKRGLGKVPEHVFAVHIARGDIDWLIAEVERLRGECNLWRTQNNELHMALQDERQARAHDNKAFLKVSPGECG